MRSESTPKPTRRYLRNARIDSFGAFSNREIGPFGPGLNVVYGPNESGKTTLWNFIGGVLFGWENARGSKNPYRPQGGVRSGSLVFSDVRGECRDAVCTRVRNSDGLIQDGPEDITGGIDAESYRNVFLLDGDALRKTRDVDEMVDRLLTAGSGAGESPAAAARVLDKRMKACFSKSASNPESVANLQASLDQARSERIRAEADERRLSDCERELSETEGELAALRQAIDRSNERIEQFARVHDALESLDEQERSLCLRGMGSERASSRGFRPSSKLMLAGSVAFLVLGLVMLACVFAKGNPVLAGVCAGSFLGAACFGAAAFFLKPRRDGSHAGEHADAACREGAPSDAMEAIVRRRRSLCLEAGVPEESACRKAYILLQKESRSRESLQARLLESSARAGELRRILEDGRASGRLDDLRARETALEQRLDEALREYAMLLVARRALDDALDAWERSSQPAVYAQAGKLMSRMSQGKWREVRKDPEGGICLVDSFGIARSPRELSLGTCQQMHLALRAALLMVAEQVAPSLPVVADEILAGFDDARRGEAALVLAELSRNRQVLLLTCHFEVVELMRRVSPDVNVLRL